MLQKAFDRYLQAVLDTDVERAIQVISNHLDTGIAPEALLFDVVVPSLETMMKSAHESKDANLAQHFMASQIADKVVDLLFSKYEAPPKEEGCIVIGTSFGDFHGLGKKIVMGCLKLYFIKAIDLGVNVSPETFVDKAVEEEAQVIAISSMMVHTARGELGCAGVRKILKERGLEDRMKIIVGGAPYRYDENLWRKVGADDWSRDGIEAGKVMSKLISEVKKYERNGAAGSRT